jgi:hypothetical protein
VLGSTEQNTAWDLPPDRRSVDHIVLLSQWLSSHQSDNTSGLVPLDIDGLRGRWSTLRTKYPGDLVRTSDLSHWHRQEAANAEAVRDWYAVVFHLTQLIGNSQSGKLLAKLYSRRGQAWAEQGRWNEAADDFGAAFKAGASDELTLTAHALSLLASGNDDGYRKACDNLLDQYGETAHSESAWRLVWVCNLDVKRETGMPHVRLDSAREGQPQLPACQIAHAATLCRHGKCEQALAVLNEAEVFAESIDAARCWLLLAAVHHRLGNDVEAARWIKQAQVWIKRNCDTHPKVLGNRPPKLAWQQRLELELFLGQVGNSMMGVAPAPPRIEKISK